MLALRNRGAATGYTAKTMTKALTPPMAISRVMSRAPRGAHFTPKILNRTLATLSAEPVTFKNSP